MDKKQAQALIKETFESPFDKNKFVGFVKNLLNEVEEATFIYKGNYIPDAYEQYINTLERIGKYNDGEHKIDILIVKLKEQTSIERARTMQRNFIAWYLNVSRGGGKDAALVAFVSPNEDDWRFSLVKMDYRFEEGKNGRTRVKEEFTPARRWSFLVGKNESSHTAKSRLVPIIEDDEHNPTLARLEHAFIEKVTEEFFEKYRDLFLRTKETLDAFVSKESKVKANFEAKGVNTVDFAKKLLGQIVFLSFLQKKGWFGVKRDDSWGTGPKNFLRELFERKHGNYYNFFNDILEPLFYEALSRERDDNFYSRFNCKIPFLNGGLFDPIGGYDWVHTDILLPDNLFSNTYKTKEGDTGNGILDIFDRYNFTVKEDEPLEKEVAVDPEMLGKVFEKLGAITAEKFDEWANAVRSGNRTKELEANKKLAVYYTPREIVHYMCQQSIINYLSTELDGKVNKNDSETLIKYGEQISENEAVVES
ncbi:class I SAM-dependent DNA methyltransferase, partial [bacterium]|nr:class I SAM-dependent DNA methyltransferase [bacterium]